MEVKKSVKKTRAALTAGTLAAAIALTGTLAWRNMSQETVNEFRMDKNPGGRIHDDFNGVANKDIYAENFTDNDTGAPVFVRVKFLEYMETGEEAGVNRDAEDADGDGKPDRKATPLLEGADINDKTTWFLHKPDSEDPDAVKDPFHEYWEWTYGGETIYMPTFNKNKDSLSVDVNGTYVGSDDDFETGIPYDDYVTYTDGQESEELPAYYDADGNSDDEYEEGVSPAPGAGGVKKDPTQENQDPPPNYEEKMEKHTAHATLAGLGVITMEEWLADKPICNKWVWDEDGWFYWPEPVMPQTATGLLMDKVIQKKTSNGKIYYAIDVVGQFVTTDRDWGTPAETETNAETGETTVTKEPTGLYIDGFTDNAKALLERAMSVQIGEDGKWYAPVEANIFTEVTNDAGDPGDPVCAGMDKTPGNGNDRKDVVYLEGGLTVGEAPDEKDVGKYFLEPTAAEPYYRAVGPDGQLGTGDDVRLWVLDGYTFPAGVVDKIIDTVTVSAPAGAAVVSEGMTEAEVGKTLSAPFTAAVSLDGTPLSGEKAAVTWSVANAGGAPLKAGTRIDPETGVLTVDENETAVQLVVTARSKTDDRQIGTYQVKIYGKLNVKLTVGDTTTRFTSVQAGKTVQVKAHLYRGEELAPTQPTAYTWSTASLTRSLASDAHTIVADETDSTLAALTVGRGTTGSKVTFTVSWDDSRPGTTISLPITAPEAVNVTVAALDGTSAEAGQYLRFQATLDHTDELTDTTVTWKAYDRDGTDISSMMYVPNGGSDVTQNIIKVTAGNSYVMTEKTKVITIKAIANDPTAGSASGSIEFTIIPPTSATVSARSATVAWADNLTMTARLKNASGVDYASHNVTWKATDTADRAISGVTINEGGTLRLNKLIPNNTVIKVTATSTVDASVSSWTTVKVSDYDIYVDGFRLFLLKEDPTNHRALFITEVSAGEQVFSHNTSTNWAQYEFTAEAWLDEQCPTLNVAAIPTKTYARSVSGSTDFVSRTHKYFLLSEADVFGTTFGDANNVLPNDYTAGGQLIDPSGKGWKTTRWGTSIQIGWWLRSPAGGADSEGYVTAAGAPAAARKNTGGLAGMRPALWLDTNTLVLP